MTYSDSVVDEVARRCTEVESGARNVDNILTNTLLPALSEHVLARVVEGTRLSSISVDLGADSNFTYK